MQSLHPSDVLANHFVLHVAPIVLQKSFSLLGQTFRCNQYLVFVSSLALKVSLLSGPDLMV